MSQSGQGQGQAAPLTSWRGCALYAQQIIAHAGLQTPHAEYLNGAIAALLASEQQPAAAAAAGGLAVYSFGSNDKGALGQGVQAASQWEPARRLRLPDGVLATSVAAAASNTALVSADGQLLLAGTNKAYLHADREAGGRAVPTPVAALAGQQVSRVFMTSQSAHIFACINGRLMGWGANGKALGLNKRSVALAPTPVEGLAELPFPGGVPCERVRDMALGINHTVLLFDSGEVFVSGLNSRGQLGVGAPRNPYETYAFVRIEAAPGMPAAVAAACGTLHSAVVTEDGGLYLTGQNDNGQLGLPDPSDHYRFTRVNGTDGHSGGSLAGQRVTAVACGSETTLCITADGGLHGAGNNKGGDLGLGDMQTAAAFARIPLPEPAVQVSAGYHHALVLTNSGAVYAWGSNSFGQVTPGNKSRAVTSPVKIEVEPGKPAAQVLAGHTHSLVVLR